MSPRNWDPMSDSARPRMWTPTIGEELMRRPGFVVWWRLRGILMTNEQMRRAGLIGGTGQLRLWI